MRRACRRATGCAAARCGLAGWAAVLHSVPIRLSPTPTICRVLSRSRIKLGVGRCGDVAGDAEKGTEGIEPIQSSVEAEGELVEVGLDMLLAEAVMDAGHAGFQVRKDEMEDRQIRLGPP